MAHLLRGAVQAREDEPLYVDGRRLDSTMPLALLPQGTVVGVGGPVADAVPPSVGLEVAVVGGPSAGLAVPLVDEVRVGREEGATLRLADADVSRRHCTMVKDPDGSGAVVQDAGSQNGTVVGGLAIVAPTRIGVHDAVRVGESVLVVRPALPMGAGIGPGPGPGLHRFNRPPRIEPAAPSRELALPDKPEKPRARRIPMAAAALPLVAGAGLFAFTRQLSPYMLFMVASPVMVIGNTLGDRRNGHKEYRAAMATYRSQMGDVDRMLADLVRADELSSRANLPDPAAVVAAASGPTARLWERRPGDPDFLRLRVGSSDRPADVRVRAGRRAGPQAPGVPSDGTVEPPPARLVPVAVDLAQDGVVGIAGPRPAALGLVRSVLAQLAALHTPTDVRIVVLTGAGEAQDWAWTAWLPHLRPPSPDWQCEALFGTDLPTAETRVAQLRKVVEDRSDVRRTLLAGGPPPSPWFVLVLDGARRLRTVRGLADVLAAGPAQGVVAVCLDVDEPSLPAECRATAVVDPARPTRVDVRRPGSSLRASVLADRLSPRLADQVARKLAPLRDPEGGLEADVPDRARLLDLIGRDEGNGEPTITADDVLARWAANPGGRSTRAVLGVAAAGPLVVDLRVDGPHALVAGTTGAGKSELLQTLVSSLAVENRPDQLSFVLVDYKGGAAFRDCSRLPHCVGMVTDLDGHLVHRALVSLDAELKRREQVLGAVGAKDIEAYWTTPGASAPLARLVIVIDEFASLVEEVPEFVKGVVGIGMRGRSLGVHVVLATQRPGGVVSAEIRANVGLRLCLRVANPGESSDVIEDPAAARISKRTPGRAYARSGHADLTLFQVARIGGARRTHGHALPPAPPAVTPLDLTVLGAPPPLSVATAAEAEDELVTDLTVLVGAVGKAAATAGVAAAPSPWLPELPDVVPADLLGRPDQPADKAGPLAAAIGLADHPGRQTQEPLVLDLERTGNLLVLGAVRSGRTTVLRTFAAQLAARVGPADLHLYALDFGRALGSLAALPHCGAVVPGDDTGRTERLLGWLGREIRRRQALLAAAGHGSLAELRQASPEHAPPSIVVLVDRYEGFLSTWAERDAGRLVDGLDRLMREGAAVGTTFVVSADRSGFSSRLGSAIETRMVLRQADRDDYSVAGIPNREIPGSQPNGRAFLLPGMVEVQVAVLGGDPSGATQAEEVAALAAWAARHWPPPTVDRRPRPVRVLPESISAAEVEKARVAPSPEGNVVFTLGVGGDEAMPVDLDLAELGPGFTIAGPPRSGRSSALLAVARTLRGRPVGALPIVVIAPRASGLRQLEGEGGIEAVLTSADQVAGGLLEVLEGAGGPCCVLIDDAELLGEGKAAQALEALTRGARDAGHVVVAAATTDDLLTQRFRGWLVEHRRTRAGLLLAPGSAVDGEALDVKLPRSTDGSAWPAGRGLLILRSTTNPVQVTAP